MDHGKHKPRSECTGGLDCPLGLAKHPVASDDTSKGAFPLGCSLCRSNHLERIADNDASTGFNVEKRQDYKDRFDHVLGHD